MRKPLFKPAPGISRVNVMPIIDVALVLVVVLLITAPMMTVRDMDLTLPTAETRGAEDELRISISLAKNGELAVDEALVPMAGLADALIHRIGETDKKVLVVVRADASAPYDTVQMILKEARHAGASRLAIATRQGGRQAS